LALSGKYSIFLVSRCRHELMGISKLSRHRHHVQRSLDLQSDQVLVHAQDRSKQFKRMTQLTSYTTDEPLTTAHNETSINAGQKLLSCDSQPEMQKNRYIDTCVIRTHASEEMSLAGPRVNHSAKVPF
jgi:hypothetical protein